MKGASITPFERMQERALKQGYQLERNDGYNCKEPDSPQYILYFLPSCVSMLTFRLIRDVAKHLRDRR